MQLFHLTLTVLFSYLAELRNIAVNFKSLSPITSARLKKAGILVGSRCVQMWESNGTTDHVEDDEKEQDVEYDLFSPGQVAIADDAIAYQQFGRDIFCAPQETILEGERNNACPQYSMSTLRTAEFYQSLGCKRLSDLIREKHRWTRETPESKKAQEIRSLVLERLPLFLHEYIHASAQVPFTWLNNRENFIVRTFKKITVTRSINIAGAKPSISIEPSATAKRGADGAVQLWLIENAQVDMYEVAASLCRLLFDRPKVSDTFLFAMILSTDLCTLRRRGYNGDYEAPSFFDPTNRIPAVDRILNQTPPAPNTTRPKVTSKTNPSVGGKPGGRSKLGRKGPSKTISSRVLFSAKGSKEPVTGLETLLVIPGRVISTTLGIGHLT